MKVSARFALVLIFILLSFFCLYAQENDKYAVFNFVVENDSLSSIKLTEKFIECLKQKNKAYIIDINERNKTLYERKLMLPGVLSDSFIKKAIAALGASHYICCNFIKDEAGYTVKVKVVNVSDGVSSEFDETFSKEEELEKSFKRLSFKIFNLPMIGKIEIKSDPEGAEVFFNGDPSGAAPVLLDNLVLGRYKIGLYKKGHRFEAKEVLIDEDNLDIKLDVKLEKERELTKEEKINTLFRTIDTGVPENLNKICRVGENTYFAVGNKGVIIVSNDAGKSWSKIENPTKRDLFYVYFKDENKGCAAGDSGTILITKDGGKTFVEQKSGINRRLNNVFFADEENGWAVGGKQKSNISGGYYTGGGIAGAIASALVAGIVNSTSQSVGIILKTKDGGQTWARIDCPVSQVVNSLYFRDKDNGIAVGGGGAILKTKDGGATWEKMYSPTEFNLDDIKFTKDGTGYISGGYYYVYDGAVYMLWGILLRSDNGGKYWETEDSMFLGYLTGFDIFRKDDYICLGIYSEPAKTETFVDVKSSLVDYMFKNFGGRRLNDVVMINPYKALIAGEKGIITEYYDEKKEHVYISKQCADEKNYNKAVEEIKKNIDLDPSYEWTYFYLGSYYEKLGLKDKAVNCYKRFIYEKPFSAQAAEARDKIIELTKS